MTPTLSDEQRLAIAASKGAPVSVRDPQSQATYVIVEAETHRRAMDALDRQFASDSIRRGIEQMEAGLGRPAAEAEQDLRAKLGFPPRP